MKKQLIFVFALSFSVISQAQDPPEVLKGKWKIDGKNAYEVWHPCKSGLVGYSYQVKEGKEAVMEHLRLLKEGDSWIYEPTVPDQNEGKPIPFILNSEVEDRLSFENLAHDFPVKIQYQTVTKDRLHVIVLGSDGNGFDLYLDRIW